MPPAPPLTTSAELLQGLERLSPSDFVALDTEFVRESTYYPRLCLIQAASAEHCLLIDPLAGLDLDPLWRFLEDRARVKVLHAARQDLEVLATAIGPAPLPGPIFDTQIAAALLGSPAQIGYGSLVAERLNVTLAKGHTRTDWSKRPLSTEQLAYAEDDVRYLAPLYLDLREALRAAGRLDWLHEDTLELERPELHRTEPEAAWRRLKGLERLKPAQRAAAKLLAQWRESAAIAHDRPRGWILADEALREIAERLPGSIEELERVRSLSAGIVRKRGAELLAVIERGQLAASEEPEAISAQRPDPEQVALVTRLLAATREQAQALGVTPEILATRRDVERLVLSGKTDHLLSGWRRGVIGERLVGLASGDAPK